MTSASSCHQSKKETADQGSMKWPPIGERRESRDNVNRILDLCHSILGGRRELDRSAGDAARQGGAPCSVESPGLVNRCILGRGPDRPKRHQDLGSTVRIYREDVKIWREPIPKAGKPSQRGGIRGKVVQFTKATARRLRWFVRNCPELNAVGVTAFAHCTYPADFPTDGRTVKLHLERLRHRLTRLGIGGVWVLEFQQRGAPHLHMILTRNMDKEVFSRMWFEVVGSNDPKHLAAGTRIEPMEEPHGAARYVAGYCSKLDQKTVPEGFESVGRFWGHWGGINAKPVAVVESTVGTVARIVRTLRRAVNSDRSARYWALIRQAVARDDRSEVIERFGWKARNWVVSGPVWRRDLDGRVTLRGPHSMEEWEIQGYNIKRPRKVKDRGLYSFSLYSIGKTAAQLLGTHG